ncbi:uncharacterized protein K460DRAFT_169323 [Cucurbitaria berberidis CBS 394.84]|uniref:Uncharacterized protein n=1 Tax=Cucurbitaria berberidis CBS 394.84 TaxID=1168544 RepID=A0A9P4G9D5_9PLEO|nr:uncharacterized protein K460DRAFT_169323 [Cucurbitaria berberidis CBS 394.84]KAF1841558.1 hypothetical protein K460DRAFT_169323 [Cucurbitaria berberidis CBS 394.84]
MTAFAKYTSTTYSDQTALWLLIQTPSALPLRRLVEPENLSSAMPVSSIFFGLLTLAFATYTAAVSRPSTDLIERNTTFSQIQPSRDSPHKYNFHEFRPRDDP